jgi:hypothetical protein
VGLGAGGGGGWRGVNHTRVKRFWPCADTRTVTLTRIPGGALSSGNQNVCRPVAPARAVIPRSPASKCATTVILAPGAVDTWMPTLVPVRGRLRVTDAALVSRAGGGEVVGVGEGAGELETVVDAGSVPTLAAGFGGPAIGPITPRTMRTPATPMIAVHTLWRAGQLLRGGCGGCGGWPGPPGSGCVDGPADTGGCQDGAVGPGGGCAAGRSQDRPVLGHFDSRFVIRPLALWARAGPGATYRPTT